MQKFLEWKDLHLLSKNGDSAPTQQLYSFWNVRPQDVHLAVCLTSYRSSAPRSTPQGGHPLLTHIKQHTLSHHTPAISTTLIPSDTLGIYLFTGLQSSPSLQYQLHEGRDKSILFIAVLQFLEQCLAQNMCSISMLAGF